MCSRLVSWAIIVVTVAGAAAVEGSGLCQTRTLQTDQGRAFTSTCGGASVTVTDTGGAILAEIPITCCTTGAMGTDGTRVYVISEEFASRFVTSIDISTLQSSWPAVLIGLPVNLCAGDLNIDGHVTIDEILAAVNAALNGCPVLPGNSPE